jgi:hypothetical protein
MGDFATLHQLQNIPAGTLVTERRYTVGAITIDGAESRMGREYRTAARVAKSPTWWERELRIQQLEPGFTGTFDQG